MTDKELEICRQAFENWLTDNKNYPHLAHKSFGGNYLHEEAAMKWDAWKTAWNTRASTVTPQEARRALDRLMASIINAKAGINAAYAAGLYNSIEHEVKLNEVNQYKRDLETIRRLLEERAGVKSMDVSSLSDDDLAALEASKVDDKHKHLDSEVDDE